FPYTTLFRSRSDSAILWTTMPACGKFSAYSDREASAEFWNSVIHPACVERFTASISSRCFRELANLSPATMAPTLTCRLRSHGFQARPNCWSECDRRDFRMPRGRLTPSGSPVYIVVGAEDALIAVSFFSFAAALKQSANASAVE